MPREVGARVGGSPGPLAVPEAGRGRKDPPPWLPEGVRPRPHLDFPCLASGVTEQNTSVVEATQRTVMCSSSLGTPTQSVPIWHPSSSRKASQAQGTDRASITGPPSLRAPRSVHTHPPGPAPAGTGHIWLSRATSGYPEACPGPRAVSQGSGHGRGQAGFPAEISGTRAGSGSSCKCLWSPSRC